MLGTLPPATRAILFANIGVFALQALPTVEPILVRLFALWPLGALFQPWQVVTYGFLHGGLAHLFFNMFALFMFGRELEELWGSRRFAVFYFASVLAAA